MASPPSSQSPLPPPPLLPQLSSPPSPTVPLLLMDNSTVQLRIGAFPILEKSVDPISDWVSPTPVFQVLPDIVQPSTVHPDRSLKWSYAEIAAQEPQVSGPAHPLQAPSTGEAIDISRSAKTVRTKVVSPPHFHLNPKSELSMVDLMKGRCMRCGDQDHHASECRNPKLCFRCGQTGHRIASCPLDLPPSLASSNPVKTSWISPPYFSSLLYRLPPTNHQVQPSQSRPSQAQNQPRQTLAPPASSQQLHPPKPPQQPPLPLG